jgi:hypothetical protein
MTAHLSHRASGAIRRFAGWVARGTVGHPMLDHIDYWREAPLWDPNSIAEATKDWFKYLG